MTSTFKNNKNSLTECLITFNTHVVGMKNAIKKAKIIQMTKIVRKIKMLTKKKGNDAQLTKNKRKYEHLKEEINFIKKTKLIEVVIFAFENENVTFEEYIKKNKSKLSHQSISLARLSLCKQIGQSIAKIKADPKIAEHGWKHTFIQYKSRWEKRKSWKEKTKQLKEIENKLKDEESSTIVDLLDANKEKGEDNETKKSNTDKKIIENNISKEEGKQMKNVEKIDREDKLEDLDSQALGESDSESDISMNSADYDNFQNKIDDEDEDEELDEEDDQENEEEEEDNVKARLNEDDSSDESELDLSNMFVYSKSNLDKESVNEDKSKEEKKSKVKHDPKRLVIEANKPAHMEIKQIDLDEFKDLDEIPIEMKRHNDADDDDERESLRKNKVRTVKIEQDPFFLDKDGREIAGDPSNDYNQRPSRFSDRDRRFEMEANSQNEGDNFDDKRNFNNKKFMFQNSSFKNSLSSSRGGYSGGGDFSTGFRNKSTYGNGSGSRYNNERISGSYNRNNSSFNNKNSSGVGRNDYASKSNDSIKNNGSRFASGGGNGSFKKPEPPKVIEDLSKLHPSWLAKKQMEDKLKTLKFNGKKITFSDND